MKYYLSLVDEFNKNDLEVESTLSEFRIKQSGAAENSKSVFVCNTVAELNAFLIGLSKGKKDR